MNEKENFYDEQIAPELARLANLCVEHGMSFVAAVEYAPGDIGETRRFAGGYTWPMELVALAIVAMGNIDRLFINVARIANQRADLDETSSMVLRAMNRGDK